MVGLFKRALEDDESLCEEIARAIVLSSASDDELWVADFNDEESGTEGKSKIVAAAVWFGPGKELRRG